MEANHHCYTFQYQNYRTGLLDAGIDATYVVHLRNNGRYSTILNELDLFRPTRNAYIVINDGYKTGQKQLPKQQSNYDLVDAVLQIYRHANLLQYRNILVLEDDCIFSKDLKDPVVREELSTFFTQHIRKSFVYRLGTVPFFLDPFRTHIPSNLCGGTHACVVSEAFRVKALTLYASNPRLLYDIDDVYNYYATQYLYYKPLAYQLFFRTENRDNWYSDSIIAPVAPWLRICAQKGITFFGIDSTTEPGYSQIYCIAKLLYIVSIAILGYLFYYLLSHGLVFLWT